MPSSGSVQSITSIHCLETKSRRLMRVLRSERGRIKAQPQDRGDATVRLRACQCHSKCTRGSVLQIVIWESQGSSEQPGMDGIVGGLESTFEPVENGKDRCGLKVYNPIQAASEVLIPGSRRAV